MSNELITQLRAMQEREYDTFGDIGDTTAGRAADALERLEGKIADAAHLVKTGGIEICRERQRAEAAEARVKELELKLVRQDEVAREACEAAVWKYGQERMELEARVAELEAELNKRTDAYMNEPHCCSGRECGCMGLTRFEQIVGEELGQRMATMREQNARLRAALEDVSLLAHCISKAGPLNTPDLETAWRKFDLISVKAAEALVDRKAALNSEEAST